MEQALRQQVWAAGNFQKTGTMNQLIDIPLHFLNDL